MSNKVNKHREICEELNSTYAKKNHDYGDAFGKSVKEHGAVAGLVRMEDKFNRLKHIIRTKQQLVNDETLADTLLDLANYAIMLSIEIRSANGEFELEGWSKFSDNDWTESVGTE